MLSFNLEKQSRYLFLCADEKSEAKDLRSDIPGKIKLPSLFKTPPPPIKDKPQKLTSK